MHTLASTDDTLGLFNGRTLRVGDQAVQSAEKIGPSPGSAFIIKFPHPGFTTESILIAGRRYSLVGDAVFSCKAIFKMTGGLQALAFHPCFASEASTGPARVRNRYPMYSIDELVQDGNDMYASLSFLRDYILSNPTATSISIKVSLGPCGASNSLKFYRKYYWVAVATLLFYNYFLTLRDEVGGLYVWAIPPLTPSRCNMHGRGRSHGVRRPSSEGSIIHI